MPRTATFVTFGTIVAVLLLNIALPTILPSVPIARASSRTISLVGNQAGWNYSLPSGVNPNITVTEGDTITVNLSSSDFAHNFFVDVAGNSMWTCPPNVGCSAQFGPSPTTVTFTVSFAPGTYKYVCSLHPVGMKGNFIVQAPPDFGLYSNPTSLVVRWGSSKASAVTINETGNSSGNVTLSASVQPSGLTLHLNPLTVNFSPTLRAATATLNVTAPIETAITSYKITITGYNGTVSRSTMISVSVEPGPIGSPPPPPDFALLSTAIFVGGLALVIGAAIYIDRRRRSKLNSAV